MAMSNVFCKTGWTLRITLKTSLKMNSKKGAQSGRTWELLAVEMTLTVSKRLTQSNMCIVNTSQWGPEAMSCLGLPRSIFQRSQGTFSIYHRLGQVFSVCSWLPIHNAVLGDTKILRTFWLKITSSWKKIWWEKDRNLRRFIFTIWEKTDLILCSEMVYSLWTWPEFKKWMKTLKIGLDSPEN